MTSEQKYPTLFSGFRVGSLELKNRIVHASMTTRFARDGKVSAKLKHYFSNRAKGGVSIIVSEPINGHRYQSDPRKLDVFNNRAARSLAATVNALAKFDCHLLGQLQDNGRGRREQGRNNAAIGVSALPDDLSWTVPHVMSTQEVYQLLEDFVLSCKNLKRSGLSGVEVSAGHGHLFHQFLSPWCNQRDDEFGGDLAGRTRFLGHLIQGIRDACGKDFLVGMKLPGADGITGSIDEAEAFAIAEVLGAKAIDYWTFAWGSHSHTLYHHLPDAFGERTPYAKAIGKLRQASPKIATGALGYLTDPNEAERLLVDGKADLIMLGRPLVTDPGWGVKAEQGREADIRYCVSCNTCWRTIVEGDALQCDNNPRVGQAKEMDWKPPRAKYKKRIVVVGSGVAGMEAAWVAAARDHQVTVFGQSAEVGGKTRIHSLLPGGENLSSIYDYQFLKATHSNVRFEFGIRASVQDVLSLSPDRVVLATGSRLTTPHFLADDMKDVVLGLRQFSHELVGTLSRQKGCLVIYDQDHTEMTYAAAEYFADYFQRVVIVTTRERIASDVSLVNRQGVYQRLLQKRVEIVTNAQPMLESDLEAGEVTVANVVNGDQRVIEDVVALTYATPRQPNDELLEPLQKGLPVDAIGDCYAPRSVLTATREGHWLGVEL